MKADAIPVRDERPTRAVVRYEDVPGAPLAIDVLVCGHKVPCTRKPGGRVLRAHEEPCGECDRSEDEQNRPCGEVVVDERETQRGTGRDRLGVRPC